MQRSEAMAAKFDFPGSRQIPIAVFKSMGYTDSIHISHLKNPDSQSMIGL